MFAVFNELSTATKVISYSPGLFKSVILDSIYACLIPEPSSLIVYLEDGSALAVDVTWHCDGDDFDTSDADYYQFTPTWDESFYLISGEEDLQVDIPCIEVFITEDGMGMRAVTSSKNETTIYNFLKSEMGLNTAAACGVLANIQKESKAMNLEL